jgi:predicted 3-demethylubiquinone-9 3-methyltransferase (glyoxalase superfamily)
MEARQMSISARITPHLWFDKEAKEAAEFYVSAFPGSEITNVTTLHDTPSGSVDIVAFRLSGHPFEAISAGPLFKFNPSVSFILNFDPSRDKDARGSLDRLWEKLSPGGQVMMPLDKYPFSERFGWLQDKYGLSWQFMLSDAKGEERPFIVPALMFTGKVCGKAEQAIDLYVSVFKDAKRGNLMRYGQGDALNKEGSLMFGDFMIEKTWLAAMDSGHPHGFGFNEAISFMVRCKDQGEIDYFWSKLSAVPESEQCGWIKDKFGLSWQIVPAEMDEMMKDKDPEKLARLTEAFLGMKKFDIAELKRAYRGE